uniref:Rubredoxin n=1 Tax=Ignisphaera aggregans TaxID=334771 RepID=A0A7J3Z8F4_9CREN
MVLWKCSVCGYVFEGAEAPDKCPKCGAPKEKFVKLSDVEEKLVLRSRLSNSLHIEAYTLLQRLVEIAEKGIQDNLDPPCVKIFTEEKEFALNTMQKIKAELEAHMKKGKWG